MRAMLATVLAMSVVGAATGAPDGRLPQFELVQPDLFSAPGGQANAWADFDGDGDLDEFVGFRGRPNRLYRQDHGVFSDVAAAAGLADTVETRAAAWGDFDNDGDADLYVGFAGGTPNKLYRNDGGHFTDVAREVGVNLTGVSRQAAFIDYDNDGDLDLFAAFRERPNQLFRNDGGRLVNVTESSGIGDPRKTVGAVWFDADRDGDLDLFVANQDGDLNALFLNDRGHFTDVAAAWGVDGGPRSTGFGGVGPAVADYDGDGFFDLFVANYGPSVLYRNERGRRFTDVTRAAGASFEGHAVTASWGDYDNDGRPDLYVSGFLANEPHYPDHLLHQDGAKDVHFSDVMPDLLKTHDASHGVQWIDFDNDGALDLALANNDPQGGHYLFHNRLAADRTHASLSVDVVDSRGRHTKPGAEVRVYAGGRRLVSSALLDTGSGYCSQNSMPVHVGVAGEAKVDVEVTVLTTSGRRTFTRKGVNPRTAARPLVITAPD
jgi:hypothetical protein